MIASVKIPMNKGQGVVTTAPEVKVEPNSYQLSLGKAFAPPVPTPDDREKETITYKRGKVSPAR